MRLRQLTTIILSLVVLASAFPAAAAEPPRVFLEVEERIDPREVDLKLTRRLIALELSDVSIPPPPTLSPQAATLYFRVLSEPSESLRVELWQLGQAYGARRVSSRGTSQLRARRIALAAGELARQLRHRRSAEARVAERARLEEEAERRRYKGIPIYGRFLFSAAAQGAVVGPGDLWLAGPALSLSLRFTSGLSLELGGAHLAGAAPGLGGALSRWTEVSLAPSYFFSPQAPLRVGVGVLAAAAVVRVAGSDVTPLLESGSARVAAQAFFEPRLRDGVRLRIGPQIGAVLHPLAVPESEGRAARLGGLWVGLTAGILLDPSLSEM